MCVSSCPSAVVDGVVCVRVKTRWLVCLHAAERADVETPHPTVPHRETTRFVAVSQYGAGAGFDVSPDGSFGTTIPSTLFEMLLQTHGGLDVACASAVCDRAAAAGTKEVKDRKGDYFVNDKYTDKNKRHNMALSRGYDMLVAVAVGEVGKGDKEDPEKTADLNEGHAVDLYEMGGDEDTGGDTLLEFKVGHPNKKTAPKGRGSRKKGGAPAAVGHKYAFGNTEEQFRLQILGCKARGRTRDGPLDHTTGRGWVQAQEGDYYDAQWVKGSRVIPMIFETYGGIAPHSLAYVKHLARRAKGKGARDSTKYGTSRTATRSFFVHHTQRMAMAAQIETLRAMRKRINGDKCDALHACRARPADGAAYM